ncbi:MAG: site-specific integrase [Planctomycetes bacterium]|nr:site-specific integrase [Planctomycetota bacterium]
MNEQVQTPTRRTRRARREHVYLDERTGWWIADYVDAWGHRKRVKAARTREAAVQVRRKLLDEVDRQKAGVGLTEEIAFPQLVALYRQNVLEGGAKTPKTVLFEKAILPMFEAEFGKRRMIEIRPQDVEAFQARRAREVKAATVNRQMNILRCLFRKAVEWNYLIESPARRVKRLREENTKFRYLTPEEAERLVRSCGRHLRPVVLTALHSGLRLGEDLALQWGDIDFDRGILTVRNGKNGRMRHVPLNRTLTEALRGVRRLVGCPHVFCRADGIPYASVKVGFIAARKRAGLDDVRFHDLRHTFASWLVIKGEPLTVVKELLGHASFEMTLRYAHLAPNQKVQAVGRLDEVVQKGLLREPVGTPVAHEPLVGRAG